ncbi:uncharacterized protein LOC134469920 [Engraulis encrasicolus]|uniref:uncharacterized protein LOC134469920 n=1 Tax=Engraulis encrasicolus TaxID=184585 RepID=UPI002FD3512C
MLIEEQQWYLGSDCSYPIHKAGLYSGLAVSSAVMIITIALLSAYVIRRKTRDRRERDIRKDLVSQWLDEEVAWPSDSAGVIENPSFSNVGSHRSNNQNQNQYQARSQYGSQYSQQGRNQSQHGGRNQSGSQYGQQSQLGSQYGQRQGPVGVSGGLGPQRQVSMRAAAANGFGARHPPDYRNPPPDHAVYPSSRGSSPTPRYPGPQHIPLHSLANAQQVSIRRPQLRTSDASFEI